MAGSLRSSRASPTLWLRRLRRRAGLEKAVELFAVHGAVDVVGGALVPAGGHVDAVHVDGFGFDDGRDGVVEGQVSGAGEALDLTAKSVGGKGAGSEDCALRAVLILDE